MIGTHVILHCLDLTEHKRFNVPLDQVARIEDKDDKIYGAAEAQNRFDQEKESKPKKIKEQKDKKQRESPA